MSLGIEEYGGGQEPRPDVLVVTTVAGATRACLPATDVGTEVCAYGTAVVLARE